MNSGMSHQHLKLVPEGQAVVVGDFIIFFKFLERKLSYNMYGYFLTFMY